LAAELAVVARGWCAAWAQRHELAQAPLVALDAPVTPAAVTAIWTLIELGIPLLPLHPAWSLAQRRKVISDTGAVELTLPERAPVPYAGQGDVFGHLRRPVLEESTLAVVFTSGSSGQPQGAQLSHRAFWASAMATRSLLGDSALERWYVSLPLAHIGGLSILTRAAVLGSTVVLPPSRELVDSNTPQQGRFDARSFHEQCERHNVTAASLVPTQLRRLVTLGLKAPGSLRLALLGGAPADPSLIAAARTLDWPVHRTYGLTEACSQVATDRVPGETQEIALLPQVNARIEPDGRLALHSDTLFSGYWGQPLRSPTEWFVTSDLAVSTERGLSILGRADEVVISGGEKIHPAEVDVALNAAPGVRAGCAFGRPSEVWGEELCAALVLSGTTFDPAALVSHLREQLPSFKVPKAWALVSELPLTASGKVSRRLCREHYSQICQPLPLTTES
jgi:O-succinylbenzoic acid--CoA ligase